MAKDLTAKEVENISKLGMNRVADNLYLSIDRRYGSKSWMFRYRDRVTGKLRDKGLGRYPDVSLKDARKKAYEYRFDLNNGIDPIQAKQDEKKAKKLEQAKAKTFGDCANAYIDAHRAEWKNPKHTAQWESTLAVYCADLMKMPVKSVDKEAVLDALKPIWEAKTETATRVRQRIEAVMDYALERGYCKGENPARWKGGLRTLLANPVKLKKVKHQPALQYVDIAEFMAELTKKGAFVEDGGLSYKSLAFIILTATRVSEVINADWSEINLKAKTWTIPQERMKGGREHKVPLSENALEILATLHPNTRGFIFPNGTNKHGNPKPITIAAPYKVCKEMKRTDDKDLFRDEKGELITTHGFRATFKSWASDNSAYSKDVAEASLAHVLKDKTEAAYRRTDMLDKRARLMAEWANYCFTSKTDNSNVTPIGKAKSKHK